MENQRINPDELLVVGIASSAGGVTPLKELISTAICHHNMSFVMVPHLLRDHESELPKLMKTVSKLKICTIEDGMPLKICHLYILPPGYYAKIENRKFKLVLRPEKGINLAANFLFHSLAESFGRNAIGVVLSGAAVGSDGSDGIVAIKKAKGHTYAQDPNSAEFPDMPLAAIKTGCVDTVMSAQEIGHELTLVSWAAEEK